MHELRSIERIYFVSLESQRSR